MTLADLRSGIFGAIKEGNILILAASVLLAWDANPEPDLAGYKIHVGIESFTLGNPPVQTLDVGNVTQSPIDGLSYGTQYFFVATAYNQAGLESVYSNEVTYTPVPPVPDKIRFFVPLVYNGPHRMAWGYFSGSNDVNSPYTRLYLIQPYPRWNWNEITLPAGTLGQYRFLRYDSPKWQGNQVGEIEFWINGVKATGTPFGTGTTYWEAFDGDTTTSPKEVEPPFGNYLGIDRGL